MKLSGYKKEANPRNYEEHVIFTYSIEHLLKKDKVRFYYALKGRDGKSGIAKQDRIEQLGRAVLLVPVKFADDTRQFLEMWKCRFGERKVMVEK